MQEAEDKLSVSVETKHSIQNLWSTAHSLGLPCAVWRLPEAAEICLLISTNDQPQYREPQLEELSSCFIVNSFSGYPGGKILILEGHLIFRFALDGSLINVRKNVNSDATARFLDTANQLPIVSLLPDLQLTRAETGFDWQDEKLAHMRRVEVAVTAIRNRQLKKVVLSRTKSMDYDQNADLTRAFLKLEQSYKTALVSLVSLPWEQEVWLGASPELLISTDSNQVFRTMALAGTQTAFDSREELIPRYSIRWGQKEIEEQALVSRYVVECFKKIRLREYLESGPKTVLAGNVYHLRTDFEIDMTAVSFPTLGSIMLDLLHPTSAVCGTPKETAFHLIRTIENHNRSLYSGYWGPVNLANGTNIFVNLRTVQFSGGRATFYAGGGITEDSSPESEWEETEMKCETLIRVLSGISK